MYVVIFRALVKGPGVEYILFEGVKQGVGLKYPAISSTS